ncbi:uncharacterized protein CLUP02_10797, partial [Colletotrichum lupini]
RPASVSGRVAPARLGTGFLSTSSTNRLATCRGPFGSLTLYSYGYQKERQHILLYSPSVAPWKQSYYSIPIASSRLVEPAETQQKRRSPLVPAFFEAPRRYELVALLISMPCNAAEPLGRHAASQCQSHSAIRT